MSPDSPSHASGVSESHRPSPIPSFRAQKPWLSVEEQIACLKHKGVRFDLCSETQAAVYLKERNNYFRLGSYRRVFPRAKHGNDLGRYINLDFAMLIDISTIDLLLRQQILPMALDVEHFEKMRLLDRIEGAGEDGYKIVADFLEKK